jgi:hypothetical protein
VRRRRRTTRQKQKRRKEQNKVEAEEHGKDEKAESREERNLDRAVITAKNRI